MYKAIVILIFCVFYIANAKAVKVPSKFSIISFAINSYDRSWQTNITYAKETSDAIVNSFKSNLKDNYPSVTFSSKQYLNEKVTKSRFTGNETENYNFVFYNGHGNVNLITMWPKGEYVYNRNKKFGGKTYWAMINSCLVFKNGEADQEPWFNGVHSILGYSSLSKYYKKDYKRSCGFLYLKTCHTYTYSYYVERDFATNWIEGKQGIAMAYFNAVNKWIHKDGGFGVEPKIVYRYGYVDGKFFDPWEETFENSIQKPVFKNNEDYDGIGSRWVTLGTPEYK